jgi:hypothetical protein
LARKKERLRKAIGCWFISVISACHAFTWGTVRVAQGEYAELA